MKEQTNKTISGHHAPISRILAALRWLAALAAFIILLAEDAPGCTDQQWHDLLAAKAIAAAVLAAVLLHEFHQQAKKYINEQKQ